MSEQPINPKNCESMEVDTATAAFSGFVDNSKDVFIRVGDYSIGPTIGSGTFGKVKIGVHHLTKHKVAIKILNRKKVRTLDVASKIRREIQNLKLFRHPHIIKLYEVISTPSDFFMVMEFVGGGELFDYIVKRGRLGDREARRFFQQIISGVEYCHRHMVVHRDLKPENLLLDYRNNIKIADFGLSNLMLDGEFLRTSCGSPNYAAPEVISGKLYCGPEVDIWSCGVILYALHCGTLPFDDKHIPSLFRKIKGGIFRIPENLKKDVVALICQMLQVDPLKRATMQEIKKNTWFRKDLQAYMFPMTIEQDLQEIDNSAVALISDKFGSEQAQVHKAVLEGNTKNKLNVAYNLIIDNKRFENDNDINDNLNIANAEVRNFCLATGAPERISPHLPRNNALLFGRSSFVEGAAGGGSASAAGSATGISSSTAMNVPGANRAQMGRISSWLERQLAMSVQHFGGAAFPEKLTRRTPMKRSKWHLGIRTSQKPDELMSEVYRAMISLNFEWKIINPYHVRVRWINPTTNNTIKLALQVYQVDASNHLLDFKSLSMDEIEKSDDFQIGNTPPQRNGENVMEFFEMCSALIARLSQ